VRTLEEVVKEIRTVWPRIDEYSVQYLDALGRLNDLSETYYTEKGADIAERFLYNAGVTWRGADARRIKAELRSMITEVNAK
jgi:hypothetical protein